jgi:hypothetical protein
VTFPPITFAAPIVRAALATLEAGMPAQVVQFNAEPANTIDLEVPQTYHFGGQDILSAYAFPQVEVAVVDGQLSGWSLGQVDADHGPTCNVVAWLEGEKGEIPELYEQALGLGRCVIECLAQPGAFGANAIPSRTRPAYWRVDTIPADPTSDGREFRRWRTPFFAQFPLDALERFG